MYDQLVGLVVKNLVCYARDLGSIPDEYGTLGFLPSTIKIIFTNLESTAVKMVTQTETDRHRQTEFTGLRRTICTVVRYDQRST